MDATEIPGLSAAASACWCEAFHEKQTGLRLAPSTLSCIPMFCVMQRKRMMPRNSWPECSGICVRCEAFHEKQTGLRLAFLFGFARRVMQRKRMMVRASRDGCYRNSWPECSGICVLVRGVPRKADRTTPCPFYTLMHPDVLCHAEEANDAPK